MIKKVIALRGELTKFYVWQIREKKLKSRRLYLAKYVKKLYNIYYILLIIGYFNKCGEIDGELF